jgi:hypothetical protein
MEERSIRMKGYNFYAEYESKRAKRTGTPAPANVIAVFTDQHNRNAYNPATGKFEGFGSVFGTPNSAVEVTAIDPGYLRERCKRIAEAQARKLHPRLFERLDEPDPLTTATGKFHGRRIRFAHSPNLYELHWHKLAYHVVLITEHRREKSSMLQINPATLDNMLTHRQIWFV